MSPPNLASRQKLPRPPTPHTPAGCGAATRAEALALALGITLAGTARSHIACKPTRKACDSEDEFYAATQRYQADSAFSIAGAMQDFAHLEPTIVMAMLDVPELLRRPLTPEGYRKLQTALREAAPGLTAELKKGEVARVAARTTLKGQGELFAMDGRGK